MVAVFALSAVALSVPFFFHLRVRVEGIGERGAWRVCTDIFPIAALLVLCHQQLLIMVMQCLCMDLMGFINVYCLIYLMGYLHSLIHDSIRLSFDRFLSRGRVWRWQHNL